MQCISPIADLIDPERELKQALKWGCSRPYSAVGVPAEVGTVVGIFTFSGISAVAGLLLLLMSVMFLLSLLLLPMISFEFLLLLLVSLLIVAVFTHVADCPTVKFWHS